MSFEVRRRIHVIVHGAPGAVGTGWPVGKRDLAGTVRLTADDASGRCGALPALENLVPDDPDIFTILRGPLKRA